MSRTNIIPIRHCNFISFALRFHLQSFSPCVSSSTPLYRSYFTAFMLNLSHKFLKSKPVSLHNSFLQMSCRDYISIPTYTPKGGSDAFDQTPGGHASYLSGDDDSDENGSDTNQIDKKTAVSVPVSSNGEKLYNIIINFKLDNPDKSSMEIQLRQAGVQLTTPLVMEVLLSLRYKEKLAFRFFTWAGNQENYRHEYQTYNEMIDILLSTKYKTKKFRIVCDLLDYMKRNDKTRVPFEALLKILSQYADRHLKHRRKFVKPKWYKGRFIQPEVYALNILLDAFCKCCLVEEAENMYMGIKKKFKPDAFTYNILFFGWCRVRNPTRSMQILDEMIAMGYKPDGWAYNTAVDTFCKSGMLSEAAELLEFMKSKGTFMSSPTANTYSIMIIALARNDKMDECFKVVDDMVTSGCLPGVSTYREIIEGMCLAGKTKAAYKFLENMKHLGYPPDIVTYNCFLQVLCENKDGEEAVKLYKKMMEDGCMPSVQTFNMLAAMFFKMDDPDGALEVWNEMDSQRCGRDTAIYCVMIEGLFECGRTEDACGLLEKVLNMGMRLPYQKFDSFLMQLSSIGDLGAIKRLSEHMRKFYNPYMARGFASSQKRKGRGLRRK